MSDHACAINASLTHPTMTRVGFRGGKVEWDFGDSFAPSTADPADEIVMISPLSRVSF
jgi:hypothetical protein